MPLGYSPGEESGSGLAVGRGGYDPASRFSSADAFVTQRGDHLGLTLAMRRAVLEWVLPQGTVQYVGLFLEMPDRTGAGGTEVAVSGYARVACSRWLSRVEEASVRRNNAQALRWPVLVEAVTVVGWGVWTTSTAGTLRCFDWLRTSGPSRHPVAWTIPVGSRFGVASGVHGIGLVL